MDYFRNSMGLVENCFIMCNTLNEGKPNDKFEGVDKREQNAVQETLAWLGVGEHQLAEQATIGN